jgi:hypothetical protein
MQGDGGEANTDGSFTFTSVTGLAAAKTISAGVYHTCAMLVADSFIHCWGRNDNFELGIGSRFEALVPGPATELNIPGNPNVQLVASFYST